MNEYLVYKHPANTPWYKGNTPSPAMATRFIVHKHDPDNAAADTYATVWVSPDGQSVNANDVGPSWLRSSIEVADDMGYTESNFLEILVLTGLSKEDIEGLLR